MKLIFALIFCIFTFNVHALDVSALKKKVAPVLSKVVGSEKADELLGINRNEIKLPKIPDVKSDSKSVAGYGWKDKKGTKYDSLSKEERLGFELSYIEEVYQATRRVDPSESEKGKWLNTADQGSTREGIYRALVLDNYYARLESEVDPPKTELLRFTDKFMGKFLGQDVDTETIKDMNYFTIKRIVTEKSLEMIDALKNNPAELEDWYAILSSDLASEFGQKVFSKKMRAHASPIVHKTWANRNKVDHLKSEVIIKLHKVFNSLV